MNILILNLHSALNLGDEGITRATIEALRRTYPDAHLTLAANDPVSWSSYANSCSVVGSLTTWVVESKGGEWKWNKVNLLFYALLLTVAAVIQRLVHYAILFGETGQRDLLQAYYEADIVLSCGGGNLYASRSLSPSFLWTLVSIGFSRFLNKRVVLLPQSIGPVQGRVQRMLLRMLLNTLDVILLREEVSRSFLRRIGVRKPLAVLPDLAFGLPDVSAPDFPLSKEDKLRVGVTVLDREAQTPNFSNQQAYENAVVSVLTSLVRHHGAHIYLFIQCSGPSRDQNDMQVTRRVYHRIRQQAKEVTVLDSFISALEVKAAYQKMDLVIGTRMHTGVFALSSGTPVVLIAYQPKTRGVMRMFGLEDYYCDIHEVSFSKLYPIVCRALKNHEVLKHQIANQYVEVEQLLDGWTDYLNGKNDASL